MLNLRSRRTCDTTLGNQDYRKNVQASTLAADSLAAYADGRGESNLQGHQVKGGHRRHSAKKQPAAHL